MQNCPFVIVPIYRESNLFSECDNADCRLHKITSIRQAHDKLLKPAFRKLSGRKDNLFLKNY
jgi:hypothetical protein